LANQTLKGWIYCGDLDKTDHKWECAVCGKVVSGYGMEPPEICPSRHYYPAVSEQAKTLKELLEQLAKTHKPYVWDIPLMF
jgi:hypothetical protein